MAGNITFRVILYILSILLIFPQILLLIYRIFQKKERLSKILERISIPTRPSVKNIIWVHAASVGETIIGFTVIDLILQLNPQQQFLLTTGTITSADLARRKAKNYGSNLDGSSIITHQLLPMDNMFTINKFLNYWKPKLAIFMESELWPNTIFCTHLRCNLLLLNAKISARSYKRWKNFSSLIDQLSQCFSSILAQSSGDLERYRDLGFKGAILAGNVKYIQEDLSVNMELFSQIEKQIHDRRVIFAVSIHEPEEDIILRAFSKLQKTRPNLLLIIAPRHITRANPLIQKIQNYGLSYHAKTGGINIDSSTNIFLLDTIGETGAIFKLQPISFIGGSFSIGGHNLLEPARYGAPIIFGPDMSNFAEIAHEFLKHNAAIQALDEEDLFLKLESLVSLEPNDKTIENMVASASAIMQEKQQVKEVYLRELSKFL